MKQTLPLLAALPLVLTACHGIFDDIYDDVPADSTFAEGFKSEDGHLVLMVDATSYEEWIFVDLHNLTLARRPIPLALTDEQWDGKSGISYYLVHGNEYTELSVTPTNAQTTPKQWDFAIHHFDVMTNGGSAAVAPSQLLSQASAEVASTLGYTPDQWSTHSVIVDLQGMIAYQIGYQNSYFNPVISNWATMDFSSPPPTYSTSGDVYYLRLPDTSTAALQLRSYMSPLGSKGYLTIDIKYPL